MRPINLLISNVSLPDTESQFLDVGGTYRFDFAIAIRVAVVVMANLIVLNTITILAVQIVMAIKIVMAIMIDIASSQSF